MTRSSPTHDRMRILRLLETSPPLLCSQIAWRLAMPVPSVAINLGMLRIANQVSKRRVYIDGPLIRLSHWRVVKPSNVYWTLRQRRSELLRVVAVGTGRRKIPHRLKHPITDDMRVMLEDMRGVR